MFTNLFDTGSKAQPIYPWDELLFRLLLSMTLGFIVMFVYRIGRRGEPRNRSFEITLVLLTILIAMVTKVIGDSVARAFSLVGALSIVRFRTVVRDTQDTAYVIFAVVVGMAEGANHLPVALVGIFVILVAILFLRGKKTVPDAWAMEQACTLNLRVNLGPVLDQITHTFFPKAFKTHQLISIATAKQGTALEASYVVRFKPETLPTDLVRDLNKIEGVQNVELLTPDAVAAK
jgi:uncharacterized membrane protein YhiD involved in acid resistance